MIKIKILFFASLSEIVGKQEMELSIEKDSILKDVINKLEKNFEGKATFFTNCRFAVDEEFQMEDYVIVKNCTVALIPPVSGG